LWPKCPVTVLRIWQCLGPVPHQLDLQPLIDAFANYTRGYQWTLPRSSQTHSTKSPDCSVTYVTKRCISNPSRCKAETPPPGTLDSAFVIQTLHSLSQDSNVRSAIESQLQTSQEPLYVYHQICIHWGRCEIQPDKRVFQNVQFFPSSPIDKCCSICRDGAKRGYGSYRRVDRPGIRPA